MTTAIRIEQLRAGDFFKLTPTASDSTVRVFEGYDRSSRKYCYSMFYDVNHFGEKKKGTIVYIGFDF